KNNDNIFGYGWNINLPYIERINKTGTDKLYSENYFYSSLAGELVSQGSGKFTPKTESGNFSSYNFSDNQWLVIDKQGTTYRFGSSSGTRQDDSENSAHIYKWMLAETRDTNNNYITYEYYKDTGQIYPEKIKYTGNGTTGGIFEVEFLREVRADVNKSYTTAFLVQTNYRINEIQTKVNDVWVKKYVMSYTTGDNGYRSLLSGITGLGQDESGISSIAIPPVTFEYQKSTDSWTQSNTTYVPPNNISGNIGDSAIRQYERMQDINGDSYPDIIESFYHTNYSQLRATYLNTGKNTWDYSYSYYPPILFEKFENRGGFSEIWDQGARIVDVDGDQLPDIIESRANPNGATSAYRNTGSGWSLETLWKPTMPFLETYPYAPAAYAVDLNADALTDIIKGAGDNPNEQINNGNGFNAPSTIWDTHIVGLTYPVARIVDVNGDHLPDILENYYKNVPDGKVQVKNAYINKGNGQWQQDNTWAPPVLFENPSQRDNYFGVNFVDINGDSLVDLIMNPRLENGPDRVSYLNTGSGWTPADIQNLSPLFFDVTNHITDLNADGLIDALKIYTYYVNSAVHKGLIPDLLSSITLPSGGKVSATYKSSAQYKDKNNNLLNPNLPIIIQTVDTISTTDPVSGITSSMSYEY
ncbi:VCBS repeat-containing protein, partial [Candidatus Nomurabacteria bacterium]|nr:VCBS repeat-containing protein [Candidatus Nomurabacteria bacterium]